VAGPSTGIRALDDLLGGVRIGDNLVLEGAGEAPLDPFVAAFVRASGRASGLAYVSFHVPPKVVLDRLGDAWDPERCILVDCYSDGAGGSEPAFDRFYRSRLARSRRVIRVRDVGDAARVAGEMSALEDEFGPNTRYVFDSLTGMQDVWDAPTALAYFLRSCPRLYELRTVALWLLDREAHEPSFLSRLARVTQVVVEAARDDDGYAVRVVRAEGRPPEVTGRRATLRFDGTRARLVDERDATSREALGARLRAARLARGLSQAELARRVGISPSALSQAERGTAGLSGATLARAWEALGAAAFGGAVPAPPPYRVARRGGRATTGPAPGLRTEEVLDAPDGARVSLVRVDPGASGRRPPFPTKRREVVVVIAGVLELRIGDATEALHAGDAIVVETEPVAGWRNPSPEEAVAVWTVLP
jgi:DNA-binding XRE family transcriptional regulator/quercetin dioxygenase-like cupin family protein